MAIVKRGGWVPWFSALLETVQEHCWFSFVWDLERASCSKYCRVAIYVPLQRRLLLSNLLNFCLDVRMLCVNCCKL